MGIAWTAIRVFALGLPYIALAIAAAVLIPRIELSDEIKGQIKELLEALPRRRGRGPREVDPETATQIVAGGLITYATVLAFFRLDRAAAGFSGLVLVRQFSAFFVPRRGWWIAFLAAITFAAIAVLLAVNRGGLPYPDGEGNFLARAAAMTAPGSLTTWVADRLPYLVIMGLALGVHFGLFGAMNAGRAAGLQVPKTFGAGFLRLALAAPILLAAVDLAVSFAIGPVDRLTQSITGGAVLPRPVFLVLTLTLTWSILAAASARVLRTKASDHFMATVVDALNAGHAAATQKAVAAVDRASELRALRQSRSR